MSKLAAIVAELRRGIEGEVTDRVPDRYQTDFGGLRKKQADILVTARNEQDIVHTLKVAQEAEVPVTVRGAGHSCNGQSLCSGGIILENFIEGAQVEFLENDLVQVTGRSRWREVERLLNKSLRQTPILTDYLDMSVGGTLSVGGIGLNSIVNGFQVDNVCRVRLIQPNGHVLWCSPEENEELFRFALAGLGQVGIIEKVVMKTEPYRRFTHVITRKHASISEMLSYLPDLALPDNGVQHFNGYIYPGEVTSEYGYFSENKEFGSEWIAPILDRDCDQRRVYEDFPFEVQARRDRWLIPFHDHLRLWTDYIFDYDGMVRFMQLLEPQITKSPLSQTLKAIYILLIRRPAAHTNFALLPAPPGKLLFSVGMYTMVSPWHPVSLAQSLQVLQTALQMCCACGGRPYLYGCNHMDEMIKHKLYGSDYRTLLDLRSKCGSLLNTESF